MKCIILGASGEVGGAVIRELVKSDVCFELLTALGIKETHATSRFKEFRVMGKKYKAVLDVGF